MRQCDVLRLNNEEDAHAVELLEYMVVADAHFLKDWTSNRVPPEVDRASYAKAKFLYDSTGGATSQTTGEDPFAKIKGLIQDMLAKLRAMAGADVTGKVHLKKELAKTAAKTEKLGAQTGKLPSRIETASARPAELNEDVSQLQSQPATMMKERVQMDALRQKTHMDYLQAKSDLEQGFAGARIALVNLR